MVKVALTRGKDRAETVKLALDAIKEEILVSIKNKAAKRKKKVEELLIMVKVNFVCPDKPLSLTAIEGVRALLFFLRNFFPQQILLAEGSGSCRNTIEVFERYGYRNLEEEFNVKLFDLNSDDFEIRQVYDSELNLTIPVKYAKTCYAVDYIVTIGPPKTHDTTVVTLGWKNLLMGCPVWTDEKNEKNKLHQSIPAIHKSLFEIGKSLYPDLNVLDGWEAMEGNGPCSGERVDWKVAIASTDFLAADIFCAHLMGIPLDCVEYLRLGAEASLGESNVDKMEIVGNIKPEEVKRKFKLHDGFSCEV